MKDFPTLHDAFPDMSYYHAGIIIGSNSTHIASGRPPKRKISATCSPKNPLPSPAPSDCSVDEIDSTCFEHGQSHSISLLSGDEGDRSRSASVSSVDFSTFTSGNDHSIEDDALKDPPESKEENLSRTRDVAQIPAKRLHMGEILPEVNQVAKRLRLGEIQPDIQGDQTAPQDLLSSGPEASSSNQIWPPLLSDQGPPPAPSLSDFENFSKEVFGSTIDLIPSYLALYPLVPICEPSEDTYEDVGQQNNMFDFGGLDSELSSLSGTESQADSSPEPSTILSSQNHPPGWRPSFLDESAQNSDYDDDANGDEDDDDDDDDDEQIILPGRLSWDPPPDWYKPRAITVRGWRTLTLEESMVDGALLSRKDYFSGSLAERDRIDTTSDKRRWLGPFSGSGMLTSVGLTPATAKRGRGRPRKDESNHANRKKPLASIAARPIQARHDVKPTPFIKPDPETSGLSFDSDSTLTSLEESSTDEEGF